MVFENFIRHLLMHIRRSEQHARRRVVLLMDNATIHKHMTVMNTCLELKAILLYNPPYSPHMNPVETYFKRLKTSVRKAWPTDR